MIDMEGGYGKMWALSARCVNCGHRDDAVLQHHRRLYPKPVVVSQSTTVQVATELSLEPESLEPLAA